MKIKSNYITHDMKDEQVMVDVTGNFCGIVRSNEVAAFIVNCLKEDTDVDAIVRKVTGEYEVGEDRARKDIEKVIEKLREAGAIED